MWPKNVTIAISFQTFSAEYLMTYISGFRQGDIFVEHEKYEIPIKDPFSSHKLLGLFHC